MNSTRLALSALSVLIPVTSLTTPALAADLPAVYVAIPDGSTPGVWRFEDLNHDGDALDAKERVHWSQVPKGTLVDVAVDARGIVYALTEEGDVYRMEDRNHDGSAWGAGEVVAFRDHSAAGLKLKGGLSIAVSEAWSPVKDKPEVEVHVLDLAQSGTWRLVDRDGDGRAMGDNEIGHEQTITSAAPFTASRMVTDDLGRLFGALSNSQSLARFDDINSDGSILTGLNGESAPRCMPKQCGPSAWSEYKPFPLMQDGVNPLERPFGVALSAQGVGYVSDLAKKMIVRFEDLNFDEDGRDDGETSFFYYSGKETFYDLAVMTDEIVVVGSTGGRSGALYLMMDRNGDRDAQDTGERLTFGTLPSGRPAGVAVAASPLRPLDLKLVDGVDFAPLKGPKAVVEDGQITKITLQAIDAESGKPARRARVGFTVSAGCLELCPLGTDRTDDDGYITFTVSRVPSPDPRATEAEGLKFWTYGDELFLDVTGESCSPYPTADAGADQTATSGDTVDLWGDTGLGSDAHFCWYQVDGPQDVDDLTVECGDGVPQTSFTAPELAGDYTFELHTWNDCEVYDIDEVVVTVQE